MRQAISSADRIFLAFVCATTFASCVFEPKGIRGSGNVISQTRKLESFHSIDVEKGIEVEIGQSPEQEVIVEADDNVVKHIITTVENGVLNITSDYNSFVNVASKKVIIKVPDIRKIEVSSGAQVETSNMLITDRLVVDASSGSSVEIETETGELISEASSGSHVQLGGKALTLDISSSSGSENDARRLLVNDAHAHASSGSSTHVQSIVSLDAHASSGGSVTYYRVPKQLKKKTSSGGSVTAK